MLLLFLTLGALCGPGAIPPSLLIPSLPTSPFSTLSFSMFYFSFFPFLLASSVFIRFQKSLKLFLLLMSWCKYMADCSMHVGPQHRSFCCRNGCVFLRQCKVVGRWLPWLRVTCTGCWHFSLVNQSRVGCYLSSSWLRGIMVNQLESDCAYRICRLR